MSDPLHGITLKRLLTALIERHGWESLGHQVPIRCFLNEPSLNSSLKFLRRTPWARAEVEALYLQDLRQDAKRKKRNARRAAKRAFAEGLPVEREETLAFVWPPGLAAPPVAPELTVVHRVDRAAFTAVQASIGFEVTDAIWKRLVPDAMAFVFQGDEPVAVAVAEPRDAGWVELGWVAVPPEHRGKGLGRAVCSALVGTLLEAGHDRIVGSTQDERIAALRIYLGMGFRPVPRPEKEERWAAVLARVAT